MEVSVIGSSQLNLGRIDNIGLCNLRRNLSANILNFKYNNYSKGYNLVQSPRFLWPSRSAVLSLRASSSAQNQPLVYDKPSNITTNIVIDSKKLYVGLPLDTVSSCNSINHARAIAAGLKALKLLGVDGVELPVCLDLELHVSLCFHASEDPKLPLSRIGESNPSIYFTDKSGQQYKDLSFIRATSRKFTHAVLVADMSEFLCIHGLTIGLGPDGELRQLKQHAEAHGNPLWGLSGPHDAPGYNESPMTEGFFAENGGAWENQYGDFFLSWYSSQLLSDGDRVLSLAALTFRDVPVALSGKTPLMHRWSKV
ncbi:hypothetical protein SASPL_112351 [Salvia splendens]|uniref:Beta-amylase n=1 Tax=Salvia splendens TaxID=180675 RepID=A0A8X9A373_SALSN|nr:hypothetical protein SASPL_112351 [Salvia splendens]